MVSGLDTHVYICAPAPPHTIIYTYTCLPLYISTHTKECIIYKTIRYFAKPKHPLMVDINTNNSKYREHHRAVNKDCYWTSHHLRLQRVTGHLGASA